MSYPRRINIVGTSYLCAAGLDIRGLRIVRRDYTLIISLIEMQQTEIEYGELVQLRHGSEGHRESQIHAAGAEDAGLICLPASK